MVTTIFVHQLFIEKPQLKSLRGMDWGTTKFAYSMTEAVIDASLFSEDIDFLRQIRHIVYSYLNIGSIETFRPLL